MKTTQANRQALAQQLKSLLDKRFWFSAEGVWVDPTLRPFVHAGYMLITLGWFRDDAAAALDTLSSWCEKEYAAEFRSLIYKSMAPLGVIAKGFRPIRQRQIFKSQLAHVTSLAEGYCQKRNPELQEKCRSWVNEYFVPYTGAFGNSQVMADLVGLLLFDKTVAQPLTENPPPPLKSLARIRHGKPDPEWVNLILTLQKECGWVDPAAWQALRIPELYRALGLSKKDAAATVRDGKKAVEDCGYGYIRETSQLRHAYVYMRVRLDGITEKEVVLELNELLDLYDAEGLHSPFPDKRHISDAWLIDFDLSFGWQRKRGRPRYSALPV